MIKQIFITVFEKLTFIYTIFFTLLFVYIYHTGTKMGYLIPIKYDFTSNKEFISLLVNLYSILISFTGLLWGMLLTLKDKLPKEINQPININSKETHYKRIKGFLKVSFIYFFITLILLLLTFIINSCIYYYLLLFFTIHSFLIFLLFIIGFYKISIIIEDREEKEVKIKTNP